LTDPSSPEAAAFAAVLHLAQREGLGAYRTSYQPKRANAATLIGLFVMGVLFLVVVVGVYLLVLAFMTPNLSRSRRARRLHFFEGGLILADAKGPTVWYRWDSVSCLQAITRRYANGVYVGTSYVYTMIGRDGTETKVTNFYDRPAEWGPLIQQEITRAQVPAATATLEAGASIGFGPLTINRGGMATNNRSISWGDVQEIQIAQGYLRIKRAGGWIRWSAKPVSAIPNFFVFLTAADRLRQAHRQYAQLPPGSTPN
jgi:hypothetical protein